MAFYLHSFEQYSNRTLTPPFVCPVHHRRRVASRVATRVLFDDCCRQNAPSHVPPRRSQWIERIIHVGAPRRMHPRSFRLPGNRGRLRPRRRPVNNNHLPGVEESRRSALCGYRTAVAFRRSHRRAAFLLRSGWRRTTWHGRNANPIPSRSRKWF